MWAPKQWSHAAALSPTDDPPPTPRSPSDPGSSLLKHLRIMAEGADADKVCRIRLGHSVEVVVADGGGPVLTRSHLGRGRGAGSPGTGRRRSLRPSRAAPRTARSRPATAPPPPWTWCENGPAVASADRLDSESALAGRPPPPPRPHARVPLVPRGPEQ